MKIAGYQITYEYTEWGRYDPTQHTSTVHRQCAWNHEMLGDEDEIAMVKIPIEQAEQYTCDICKKKLSEPAHFAFEKREDSYV